MTLRHSQVGLKGLGLRRWRLQTDLRDCSVVDPRRRPNAIKLIHQQLVASLPFTWGQQLLLHAQPSSAELDTPLPRKRDLPPKRSISGLLTGISLILHRDNGKWSLCKMSESESTLRLLLDRPQMGIWHVVDVAVNWCSSGGLTDVSSSGMGKNLVGYSCQVFYWYQ